jgi:acetate kinase
MKPAILSLNGGSSSLKFTLYAVSADGEHRMASGATEETGEEGRFWLYGSDGRALVEEERKFSNPGEAIKKIFDALGDNQFPVPDAVGHRIVHGGPCFSNPVKIDASVVNTLRQLVPFAPLHLPSEIQIIESVASLSPDLPQVACFDTAFHRRIPEAAQHFAIP